MPDDDRSYYPHHPYQCVCRGCLLLRKRISPHAGDVDWCDVVRLASQRLNPGVWEVDPDFLNEDAEPPVVVSPKLERHIRSWEPQAKPVRLNLPPITADEAADFTIALHLGEYDLQELRPQPPDDDTATNER